MIKFIAGLTACFVAFAGFYALASRNSSGTMSPANGPYVAGTVINPTTINSRYSDIENEISDSLSRSGKGGMLAPLKLTDGTAAAPVLTFTSDADTGFYRIGADDLGVSVGGVKKLELASALFTVVPDATLLGATTKLRVDGSTVAGYAGLWMGSAASSPTTVNFALVNNGTSTGVNAATGGTVGLNVNNATIATASSSGFAIGASGTAISGSFRGTVSWTPGTISANSCSTVSVTDTGAAVGGECRIGQPSGQAAALSSNCYVSGAGVCAVSLCNPTGVGQSAASGTYSCRVDNP